jgi:hypothetical protein
MSTFAEPASRKYEVGAQPVAGASHVSVTLVPLTAPARLVGTPGTPVQGVAPTVSEISLDVPLVPPALADRTRT